ncbi:hypothetical protein JWJ90_00870 [Desulfobulbus rhabdoformis]|uniref:hypothetical protein n=1 Tax=Desulfobulbus rhabdoformis TaxID=34032 RepID=UPI0019656BB8|nr:hypothetical protein [Desulfobulbus rhabdoformis]MBM9612832.1 hypothetical protein [Desulfobulbus rhabdoformis]
MEQHLNTNGMVAGQPGMDQGTAMAQNQNNPTYDGTGPQATVMPVHQLPTAPVQSSQMLAAGLFGMVVVGTGTLGANLHKVNEGEMSMGDALGQSVSKGAVGGLATAAATAASSSLTSGGLFGLAVTVATATGVNYLLTKP